MAIRRRRVRSTAASDSLCSNGFAVDADAKQGWECLVMNRSPGRTCLERESAPCRAPTAPKLANNLPTRAREVIMAKDRGRADYLLYVDQHAVGVIEAKPVGRA